jgi:excisionase family DNA binding protein
MHERMETAVVEWARRIPIEQIPTVLAFLSARLLTEGAAGDSNGHDAKGHEAENLLGAGELAERLGVPESWVRTEERARRIPAVRMGKYVRFKLSEVEQVLAETSRRKA